MFDFFISHSSKDKDWVKMLVEILNEKTTDSPLTIWFDEDNISPGDYILEQIEDGITNSSHIGVVLSPESVNSEWVSFERMVFQTMDPIGRKKKIIPLLLKDCEVPGSLKAIKYIDFREENNFQNGVDQLLRVLNKPQEQSLEQIKKIDALLNRSKIYDTRIGKYVYQLESQDADELYTWIEEINSKAKGGREQIEQIIFKLLEYEDYMLTLMVSEIITSLVIKSTTYNWLLSKILESKNWNVVLGGIRAYSKLAEIDEELVDISELIKISLLLDSKTFLSQQEKMVSIHIIRTVGKINRHAIGESIIKFLSTKGQVSKEIAANAIAFDFASNGPIFLTNLLKGRSKRKVESIPLNNEQIQILVSLSKDSNSNVKRAARDTMNEVKRIWGITINESLVDDEKVEISEGGKVNFAIRGPFSGFLLRITEFNQVEYKNNLPQGTVVLIETRKVMAFLFRDASGIIVDDGGTMSHRCLRLREMGVPFASINYELLKNVPDGTFISVNDEFFESDIAGSMIF